ncbi:uncharacterized protein LOC144435887 [Glandiceps talaboti]
MGKGERRRRGGRRACRRAGQSRRPMRRTRGRVGLRRGVAGRRVWGRRSFVPSFRKRRERPSRGKLVTTIGGWFGVNDDTENIITNDVIAGTTHDEATNDGDCDYDVCVTVSFLCIVAGFVMSIPGIALLVHGLSYEDQQSLVPAGVTLIGIGGAILFVGLIGCYCLRVSSNLDDDDDDGEVVSQTGNSQILNDPGLPQYIGPSEHEQGPPTIIDMEPMYNTPDIAQRSNQAEVHFNKAAAFSEQEHITSPNQATVISVENDSPPNYNDVVIGQQEQS